VSTFAAHIPSLVSPSPLTVPGLVSSHSEMDNMKPLAVVSLLVLHRQPWLIGNEAQAGQPSHGQ